MPLDAWLNYTKALDGSRVADDVLKEVLRQAEMRQEAIFQAALGMDQRASILAGGFAAAAGAIAAAALTLGDQQALFRVPAIVAAFFFAFAAALCAWACRPQTFRFPGNPPNDWAKDPSYMETNTLNEILLGHVSRLQDFLHSNECSQRKNGWYLRSGLFVAASGPVVAILCYLWWVHAGSSPHASALIIDLRPAFQSLNLDRM